MTDFTLREAAETFAEIDGIAPVDRPAFEKFLRNLTQRHRYPLRPNGKRWRADTYALETIATLRLVETAARADLPRRAVQDLAVLLQASHNGLSRMVPVEDGWRGLSLIEEAVERTRAGETFDIHIDVIADGQHRIAPGWTSDRTQALSEAERGAAEAVLATRQTGNANIADIRITLRAAQMIGALLRHLDGG